VTKNVGHKISITSDGDTRKTMRLLKTLSYLTVSFCVSTECLAQVSESRTLTGRGGLPVEAMSNWNEDSKLTGDGWTTPPINFVPTETQDPEDCVVGQIAELSYWRFRVIQVVDKKSLLVSLANSTYWVEGADTESISDGSKVRLTSPVIFIEKKDYKTVGGSKKIVKAMKMLSRTEYLEKTAPQYTLATGEKIQLLFKSTSNKGHLFETAKGEEKIYSASDFDEASRKLLKTAIDATRKTKSPKKR